jgi:F0F1-type ATP synthase assembly protein I
MAGMKMENLGEYAFLGGIVVAIIIGIFATMMIEFIPLLVGLLALLGLVVGLLNITEKDD